jgi:hypothetical protein
MGLAASSSPRLWANVNITSPTGGNNISADKALNSTNGAAFTALGNIVITEGVASDFGIGANQTLILSVPPGWQLKPGVGTVTFNSKGDITGATIAVTSSNATVTLSVGGTAKLDTLTIGGLQVQALDGANLAAADYIRNLFDNPGTMVIPGIDQDYTTFGLLNEVAGAAKALVMQTQPGATSTAGALFSPQPAVGVVDQFGNVLTPNNTTVVSAARAAGSGPLQGTLTAKALNGVASYTNLSINVAGTITLQFTVTASNLTSVTSAPIVVGPAPADHLVFVTQPGSVSAGVPFSIQPVLKTQDRFGSDSIVGLPASQLVTMTLSAGSGPLSGTASLDIGTAAGNGRVYFTNLEIDSAGTGKQLTASASGLTSAASASFAVSSATYSKLQVLLPGETAAPGTLTGKTGTPTAQVAGTPFTVTVNTVDANWNLANTIVDTVGISGTDARASMPANAPLVSGTKSFSVALNTVGSATVTATDLTDGSKPPNTSSSITVGPGAPKQLAVQLAPAAATAGVPFTPQPVIAVQDAGGNLVTSDNGRVITVARGLGTGTLQGTLTATTVNGLATFSNLSYNLAETIALNFAATGLMNVSSSNIVVGAGPFSQLQVLVPGETAAPGTSTGKTGTPISQTATMSFPVTVNAVDAQWNLINSVTDVASITSSDASATLLPANAALVAGTQTFNVTLNSTGAVFLTASDLTDGTKAAGTSSSITVTPPQFTQATGGSAISADGAATSTFTSLTGLTYSEKASGNAGKGTIIITAPAGFVFDTGGTAPNVLITRLTGTAKNTANINGVASGMAVAMTSVTSTQLVFTVTISSSGGVTCKLTWQNVRVRPSAGMPLALGNLGKAGAATVVGLFTTAKLGTLREVAGAAATFAIQTEPSPTATAGSPFAQQPVVQVCDRFGNPRTSANGVADTTVVSVARGAGSGTLQGTLNVAAANAVASFTDLSHNVATNITLAFSAPGVTTNSSVIVVSPRTADHLVFAVQPGSATYGSALSPQPVVKSKDPFGNDSTIGLGPSQLVNLALSSGTLLGTTELDIGTAAGNGVAVFSGLSVNAAGTGMQLSASSGGLGNALSSTFTVAGLGLTVSGITASDKVYDATTAATLNTAGATLSGVLNGDKVTLNTAGATGAFADKNAGTPKTINVSGLSLGGQNAGNYFVIQPTASANITPAPLTVTANNQTRAAGQPNPTLTASYAGFMGGETVATSGVSGSPALSATTTNVAGTYPVTAAAGTLSAINYSFSFVTGVLTVSPASASRLVILTQPSSGATAGVAFAQQPAVAIQDAYGNLRSSDNSTVVTAARGAGAGTLQGSLSATAVNGVASFANLSHNVANTINLSFSSSGLTNATSASIQVGPAAFSQLLVLVPGETAAPGTANGKTGTASPQVANTGFSVTVNAVDAFWNLVNTVGDTVGLSSSDTTAALPPATAMVNGTANLTVYLNTAGSFTLTASDLIDGTKAPSTSSPITVSPAQFTQATGGSAISADGAATSTFTSLTGPGYSENASGNVGPGTIILKVPPGFVFDTGGTAPTVLITRLLGTAKNSANINGVASGTAVAMTSVTSTQLVFTVTTPSSSGVTCMLKWQNARVRPTTGTPLAFGNLTRAGTASVVGFSTNANLGTLREVAGTASNLAVQTQPSASATVGVAFAQQPVIQVQDRFGNLRSSANGNADNSTVVNAASAAGAGTLQGTTSLTAANGIVAYSNLSLNVATNTTISFRASGLTGVTSSTIAVGLTAATPMIVMAQPGDGSAGSAPGTQPGVTSGASVNGTLTMTGISSVPNGIKITFAGDANRTYRVLRATALQVNGTGWDLVGSATTDSAGQGEFTDTNLPPGQGYYRAVSQ